MKKYIVLRKIGVFNADEVRQFDDPKDARKFRDILNKSEEHKSTVYYMAEIIE